LKRIITILLVHVKGPNNGVLGRTPEQRLICAVRNWGKCLGIVRKSVPVILWKISIRTITDNKKRYKKFITFKEFSEYGDYIFIIVSCPT
jgi:hypothetical protein